MSSFRCPECQTSFKLPPGAEGKKVRCSKCGLVSLIPQKTKPVDPDDQPFSIFSDEDLKPKSTTEEETPYSVSEEPEDRSFSIPSPDCAPSEGRILTSYRPEASVGYGRGVLACFLFPTEISNLLSFIIIWILLAIGTGIPKGGCWGILASGLIAAYWASYKFLIIQSSASGDSSMPQTDLSEGFSSGIMVPAIKYALTWGFVLLPAIVFFLVATFAYNIDIAPNASYAYGLIGMARDAILSKDPYSMIFAFLVFGGFFFWPMVALCVALGDFSALIRFDLIVVTIARTLPVYLLTVVLIVGFDCALKSLQIMGLIKSIPGYMLFAALMLYLEVVSMQLIGRYYHHFKRKFAWEWD